MSDDPIPADTLRAANVNPFQELLNYVDHIFNAESERFRQAKLPYGPVSVDLDRLAALESSTFALETLRVVALRQFARTGYPALEVENRLFRLVEAASDLLYWEYEARRRPDGSVVSTRGDWDLKKHEREARRRLPGSDNLEDGLEDYDLGEVFCSALRAVIVAEGPVRALADCFQPLASGQTVGAPDNEDGNNGEPHGNVGDRGGAADIDWNDLLLSPPLSAAEIAEKLRQPVNLVERTLRNFRRQHDYGFIKDADAGFGEAAYRYKMVDVLAHLQKWYAKRQGKAARANKPAAS